MKWNKSAFLFFGIFGVLCLSQNNAFAGLHDEDGHTDRPDGVSLTTPATYLGLQDKIRALGDVRNVKAISAVTGEDPTDPTKHKEKTFNLGLMKEKLLGKDENGQHTKGVLEIIKSYRDKLSRCEADDSSKDLVRGLDAYLAYLNDEVFDKISDTSVTPEIQEMIVNTVTLQMVKFLDKKKELFSSSKQNFERSDDEFKAALKQLAGTLWGNSDGTFRETIFTEAMARNGEHDGGELITKIVERTDNWMTRLEAQASAPGKPVCTLDTTTTPVNTGPSPSARPRSGTEAPPTLSEAERQRQQAAEAERQRLEAVRRQQETGGAGGNANNNGNNTGNNTGAGQQPNNLQQAQNEVAALQQGLLAAQEAARLAREQAAQQAALADQFLKNEAQRNDAANKALNDALANAQRPNNNRSNEKSEQGPQISPSLDTGKGGQQQQPLQPPPPLEQPPPPQNPFLPLLGQQNSGNAELAALLSKMADKPVERDYQPPRPAPPVESAGSAYLAEMVKILQQQMAMMQQRMAPYWNGAVQGVQNVGNRLTSWAKRNSQRGGGARLSNGTAKSGAQSVMNIEGARGPLPAALGR